MYINVAGQSFFISRRMLGLLAVLDAVMTVGVGYAAYTVGAAVCG